MAPVDRLPYEILVDILSRLTKVDLICTSRVSHDWCTISQPLLYREPKLSAFYPNHQFCYLFIRTLLTPGRERLAGYVHSLTVHYREEVEATPPVNPPGRQLVPSAAPLLIQLDPLGPAGVQIVLLMHLLPKLHTLRLTIDGETDMFHTFMEAYHPFPHVSALPLGLQTLRHVHLGTLPFRPRMTIKVLLTLMSLPCIDTIEAVINDELVMPHTGVKNDFATTIDTAAIAGTSTVTRLSLSFVGEFYHWLILILPIPRALTYLSCSDLSNRSFNLTNLRTALELHQSSLTHLDLDVWADYEPEPFGSLREWSVLRSLRIRALTLLSPDHLSLAHVLPFSLQELEITDGVGSSDITIMAAVFTMLKQNRTMVPGLRRLALDMRQWMFPHSVPMVVEACEIAGVELVHRCFPSLG